MTRFEDRLHARLQDEEFAAGYRTMDAELSLLQAIDAVRKSLNMSTEEMAKRMKRHRAALSRTFNARDANPTLDTIARMLDAVDITADIELRPRANAQEAPFTVGKVKVNHVGAVTAIPSREANEGFQYVREPARARNPLWASYVQTSHFQADRTEKKAEVTRNA